MTWDGLFISEEPPHGATVIVFRRDGAEDVEFLLLHRRRTGPDGNWDWGPPAGARMPGEDVEGCARRELDAATGLRLPLHEVAADPEWASYWAEARADVDIALSGDHDRYEWVPLDEALRRCQPPIVAEQFQMLAGAVAA